ncbi:MAG: PQQ-binding-like beta-propeller repeat protein [Planctomycetaceae bacterium]|nr:PQQ-binding-like beta-propeller repeat protein [Planctomycetaceae bacterium]
MSLIHAPFTTRRRDDRRGSVISTLIGSELAIVLMVLVAFGAALLAGADPHDVNAHSSPDKLRPIRGLAVAGSERKLLAVLSDDRCVVHDLAHSEVYGIWLRSGEERVTAMAGSPTDNLILLCRNVGRLHLLDSRSGDILWTQRIESGESTSATFSPNGSLIAVGTNEGQISLLAIDSGGVRQTLRGCNSVHSICFTPDGKQVVAPYNGTEVGVWDVATGCEVRRLAVPGGQATSLAIHPDGRKLAVSTYQGATLLLDFVTGELIRNYHDSYLPMTNVAFSPDGSEVIAAGCDGKVRWFSSDSQLAVHTFTAHKDSVRSIAFIGDMLVSGGYDGAVRAWNVEANEELPLDVR